VQQEDDFTCGLFRPKAQLMAAAGLALNENTGVVASNVTSDVSAASVNYDNFSKFWNGTNVP